MTSFATAPIKAGFKKAVGFTVSAGIAAQTLSAPTNPLAVHLGDGLLLVCWDAVNFSNVQYNLYSALSLNGEYRLLVYGLTETSTIVRNMVVGVNVFLKISAINRNGMSVVESEKAQVLRGKISTGNMEVLMSAPMGSVVPAGSVFSIRHKSGSLISLQVNEAVSFEGG